MMELESVLHLTQEQFYWFLGMMSVIAVFVFVVLFFVKAGYGKFATKNWGISIPNRVAWVLMEAPVFFTLLFLFLNAPESRRKSPVYVAFLVLFELHYFQRSFVFPLLIKGKGRMPILIMSFGIIFNICNGFSQGEWLFFVSPEGYYTNEWFYSPKFIIGTVLFFLGMFINIQSDHIIRTLRKPGDNKHYLPHKGMYNYVTSANYLGEIIEWTGYAVLTWSPSGAVFVWWTIANLVPRAFAIYNYYLKEFGEIVKTKKRIIPFLI